MVIKAIHWHEPEDLYFAPYQTIEVLLNSFCQLLCFPGDFQLGFNMVRILKSCESETDYAACVCGLCRQSNDDYYFVCLKCHLISLSDFEQDKYSFMASKFLERHERTHTKTRDFYDILLWEVVCSRSIFWSTWKEIFSNSKSFFAFFEKNCFLRNVLFCMHIYVYISYYLSTWIFSLGVKEEFLGECLQDTLECCPCMKCMLFQMMIF